MSSGNADLGCDDPVNARSQLGGKGPMNHAPPRTLTILLVEDNEDNRTVYATILRHAGYRVIEAIDGEEGVDKAGSEQPQLILMDISIPVIDGWEATRLLKRDLKTKHIPVVALTAHALASDRAKAIEIGFDGYLTKPCEPRAVLREINRLLEAH